MILTNNNLKEIKTAVNRGFGFKLNRPSGTKPQMLVVYKEYIVTPQQSIKLGPFTHKRIWKRSPGVPYLSERNLKPGQKLSPGQYRLNNILLKVKNGKSPSPHSANKKSTTPRKRPPSAKR